MRFPLSLRFLRRRPEVPAEPDPADMGTAFGMEACLEGDDDGMRSAANYGLESTQQEAAPVESPMAWMSKRHS